MGTLSGLIASLHRKRIANGAMMLVAVYFKVIQRDPGFNVLQGLYIRVYV